MCMCICTCTCRCTRSHICTFTSQSFATMRRAGRARASANEERYVQPLWLSVDLPEAVQRECESHARVCVGGARAHASAKQLGVSGVYVGGRVVISVWCVVLLVDFR